MTDVQRQFVIEIVTRTLRYKYLNHSNKVILVEVLNFAEWYLKQPPELGETIQLTEERSRTNA